MTPRAPRGAPTLRSAIDRYLSSPRCENANTRRAYAGVLERLGQAVGVERTLANISGEEIAEAMDAAWGGRSASTWNRNRAAVVAWLNWCRRNRLPAPVLPPGCERRRERQDQTRALPRAAIGRQLARRDVPLRERVLWRMLYESAARANEILALDVEDLDLPSRRARVTSKGGAVEWVYWGSGTARLLPRLIADRSSGPVFLSERRPGPARRPRARDVDPESGRARLGYDRARVLFRAYTGWELHQLRHSAATHLGEQGVPLQLIMAKTRHRSPRTVMRYVRPGPQAVEEVTELLDVGRGRRG